MVIHSIDDHHNKICNWSYSLDWPTMGCSIGLMAASIAIVKRLLPDCQFHFLATIDDIIHCHAPIQAGGRDQLSDAY